MSGADDRPSVSATGSLYCKAYYLRDLRRYPGWSEVREAWTDTSVPPTSPLGDEQVVLVHDDWSVTVGVFHGENVLNRGEGDEWREFCRTVLGFRVPDDLVSRGAHATERLEPERRLA